MNHHHDDRPRAAARGARPLAHASTIILALLAVSMTTYGSAAAERRVTDRDYSPQYRSCFSHGGAAQGITVDMHDCVAAEVVRREAALNRVYRSLMARLPPTRARSLRVAERAWIRHRQSVCDQAGEESGGGSMTPITIDDCWIEETARRELDLRAVR
jgi:uncharacterized protein YecT (DUF1311 family)